MFGFLKPKPKATEHDLEQAAVKAAIAVDLFELEHRRLCSEAEREGFVRVAFAERKVQADAQQFRTAKLAAATLLGEGAFLRSLASHYARNPVRDLPPDVMERCRQVVRTLVNAFLASKAAQ